MKKNEASSNSPLGGDISWIKYDLSVVHRMTGTKDRIRKIDDICVELASGQTMTRKAFVMTYKPENVN